MAVPKLKAKVKGRPARGLQAKSDPSRRASFPIQ